jgi:hypothetical protein
VAEVDKQLDANVDYGDVAGHFIRVDVTLPRDALYPHADDGGPVAGYVVLSAQEAIAFADELRERAERIGALNGGSDSPQQRLNRRQP